MDPEFDPGLAAPDEGTPVPDESVVEFLDDLDDVYLDFIPRSAGGRA